MIGSRENNKSTTNGTTKAYEKLSNIVITSFGFLNNNLDKLMNPIPIV